MPSSLVCEHSRPRGGRVGPGGLGDEEPLLGSTEPPSKKGHLYGRRELKLTYCCWARGWEEENRRCSWEGCSKYGGTWEVGRRVLCVMKCAYGWVCTKNKGRTWEVDTLNKGCTWEVLTANKGCTWEVYTANKGCTREVCPVNKEYICMKGVNRKWGVLHEWAARLGMHRHAWYVKLYIWECTWERLYNEVCAWTYLYIKSCTWEQLYIHNLYIRIGVHKGVYMWRMRVYKPWGWSVRRKREDCHAGECLGIALGVSGMWGLMTVTARTVGRERCRGGGGKRMGEENVL